MKAAFQMDPPSRLNPRTDSTLMILEEGCKRGIECFFFTPIDVSWSDGKVFALAWPIAVDTKKKDYFTLGEPGQISLHDMDVVWMRQDPPFNMQYITGTHLLEHLLPNTKVFNNPAAVRNAPEKLAALHYAEFMPPTLVSFDPNTIAAFIDQHGSVVAKPLHGFGGRAVFKLAKDDPNIATLIEHWSENFAEPLMWQKFVPDVATRDTRVLLINGEVAGSFGRQPQAGSIRANMRVGGTPVKNELTHKQQTICKALGPALAEQGLLFVGLDLIGDYLTEINVTCPTGLRAVEQLSGVNLAATLWEAV